jgi:xanthine dehydrogenase small subunit
MTERALQFIRRGRVVKLENVSPTRTLLEVLREDLRCTAAKEGCAEGDCGACTVVTAEARDGALHWRAINACIAPAHGIDGMALWTAEDLALDPLITRETPPAASAAAHAYPDASPAAHPVQQAIVACHASQCGFCTPGFVMSLFALYQRNGAAACSRDAARSALSGNLCRCTGYRPLLDAAEAMGQMPKALVDETVLLQKLEQLRTDRRWGSNESSENVGWMAPTDLPTLLALRAQHPQAQLIAGATDVGLWITKQHRDFAAVLSTTRVAELRRIAMRSEALRIGAAVSLEEAFAALAVHWPQLCPFFERFAGAPVRAAGTLGGNVANGSPIGDSMPLLIALGARLVLASVRGERSLPIEDFYLGYRRTALAADEVLAFVDVPLPLAHAPQRVAAWKVSKRVEDDISAVCLALSLTLDAEGQRIVDARIGAGGVAATPVRARTTEAALIGATLGSAPFDAAAAVLQAEFEPLSDLRASSAYRRAALAALLRRFGREAEGQANVSLATLRLEADA